jgi:hypothetical protein
MCVYVCLRADLQVSVLVKKHKHTIVYTVGNLIKMAVFINIS